MNIEVYDIEVLSNLFTYYAKNINTKEEYCYIIHESKNELEQLIEHFSHLDAQIGFNNLAYDSQILQFIINNYKKFKDLSSEELTKAIYNESQSTIDFSNNSPFNKIAEWKLSIPQVDLFKIWHFDNKAKMTSLKWIEYSVDLPDLQEMPIKHYDKVLEKDIPKILEYNRNDVIATEVLYNITIGNTEHPLYKGVDKLALRKNIRDEFGINCRNYNDVKIGDELNKLNYVSIKGIDKKELSRGNKELKKENFYFKDCFPTYKFETTEFNNFIKGLANTPVLLDKKQEFEFKFNETTYIIAKGGIHSKDKPRLIKPNDNEVLLDADIGLKIRLWPN